MVLGLKAELKQRVYMSYLHIYYDGLCPFCQRYTHWLRLSDAVDDIELVDARGNSPRLQMIVDEQIDMDKGIAINLNGKLFQGAEATRVLADLSSDSGFVRKLHRWVFRYRWSSYLAYPYLRSCRNFTLWLMGINTIKQATKRKQ